MKLIYFVRHGESEANVNPQARSTNPLTEKGLEQAKTVANRFKNIRIEKLIETSKIRSKQTAKEIADVTNIQPIENDLFIEREGEFEVMYEHKHLSIPELTEMMKEKLQKPHWDYQKQELFETLKERVRKAVEYLEFAPEDRIAIVTHGAFLKVLIAYFIFKDSLTEEQAVMFMKGTATSNTGITVCKFNTEKKEWRLLNWNDDSHLG
jgi:broad specificity phosphatase PhoE